MTFCVYNLIRFSASVNRFCLVDTSKTNSFTNTTSSTCLQLTFRHRECVKISVLKYHLEAKIDLLYIYKQVYTVKRIETRWKKVVPAMEGDAHGQDPGDHLVGNVQRLVEHRG